MKSWVWINLSDYFWAHRFIERFVSFSVCFCVFSRYVFIENYNQWKAKTLTNQWQSGLCFFEKFNGVGLTLSSFSKPFFNEKVLRLVLRWWIIFYIYICHCSNFIFRTWTKKTTIEQVGVLSWKGLKKCVFADNPLSNKISLFWYLLLLSYHLF